MRYGAAIVMCLVAVAPMARAGSGPAAGGAAAAAEGSSATPDAAAPPARTATADGGRACRQAIETAVTSYVRSRRGALSRCHHDTERDRLAPRDCETEPRTAARIARAEALAIGRMARRCTTETVLAEPPQGLGAVACGGAGGGACEFRFASVDDGRRGNDNDYLDCVLCLADHAVAEQIDARYAGVASTGPPAAATSCRAAMGRAAIVLTQRRIALDRRCHARDPGTGRCVSPDVAERLAALTTKLGTRLLGPCAATSLRHRNARSTMPAA